jgi:hypothetical protein
MSHLLATSHPLALNNLLVIRYRSGLLNYRLATSHPLACNYPLAYNQGAATPVLPTKLPIKF